LRTTANEKGRIDSGFRRPEDGWHIGKFLEGIDYLKTKKDGDEIISTNKAGDKNWKIPCVIDDEDDESNEVNQDIIVAENKKGEQMLTDILGATGLFKAFAKAFPDENLSIFEPKVMDKIKGKLPGQYWRFKTAQTKNTKDPDHPYVNVVGFGPMAQSVESLEAELFPEKKGKGEKAGKKEAGKAAPVVEDEEF